MPVTRAARRNITNENDENTSLAATRATRAKNNAADAGVDAVKKPVGRPARAGAGTGLSAAVSSNNGASFGGVSTAASRRRAVLGDVSNVVKTDGVTDVSAKEPAVAVKRSSRTSTLAKAGAPTKITKSSSGSSRTTRASTIAAREKANGSDGSKTRRALSRRRPESVEPASETESIATTTTASKENEPAVAELEAVPEEVEPAEQLAVKAAAASKNGHGPTTTTTTDEEAVDEIIDIDADEDDPIMVSEYAPEIYEYMRMLEQTTMPLEDYMEQQPELEWRMRGILVDWLIEVHARFRLLPETLFLTVNIVDRFLSCKVVQLDRLQLVGITAMFIASKYEEVLSPHIQSFCVVADNGFSEQEILRAERYMLQALNYDLSYPNPMNFLRRISKADEYNIESRTLGKYLLEIACLDHRFLAFPPSQVAAASMYFARLVLSRSRWDATLTYYSGYSEEELYDVFLLMIDYVRRPVVHRAFFAKYSERRFMRASVILRQWVKRCHQHFLDPADFQRDY